MPPLLRHLILLLSLLSLPALAQDSIPDDLKDWQQWVLKDREYVNCPFYFDRAAKEASDFACTWPARLQLDATANGGTFSQQWTVEGAPQWVLLPGDTNYWPTSVTVDGRPVAVVTRGNLPGIRLRPGTWRIEGRFEWDARPGTLRIPPENGLISLTVDGRRVARPEVNRNGVFLGERRQQSRTRDTVRTVVYRLVADDIPTRLHTVLQIDVSGSVREEVFGPILPEGFVPLAIQSQLPVRFEADGNLRFQVRPGRWTVRLVARAPGIADRIVRPDAGTNMPAEEIWSFLSNDTLRVTAAEGMPPVDPLQVDVPDEWDQYPAFRMDAGTAFTVTERSRGVLAAANELNLNRTLWLNFDGEGFVTKDQLSGAMRTGWRLDMRAPYSLQSASEYGENLLVTHGADETETGIEVRQTNVDVAAIGRIDSRAAMPVTGWNDRFGSVSATLNLPPGHKLFSAPGVDNASGSWLSRWQLLDFFLVLIITIGAWRLFGGAAGVITLLALVLTFHEANAPNWLWLSLLIAIALMRVAPEGKLRSAALTYQWVSAGILVLALVPFIASQLRIAIYPQLESQYRPYAATLPTVVEDMSFEDAVSSGEPMRPRSMSVPAEILEEAVVTATKQSQTFARYASNAAVQAGPGIPSWQWNSYALRWSGPVDADQSMRLMIMPRWLVSGLRVFAVVLLLLLVGILAAEILNRRWKLPGGLTLGNKGATAAALFVALVAVSPQADADVPSSEILTELQQRLLEPPECVPRCAEISSADVRINGNDIRMSLVVDAFEDIALPLPGSASGWRPELVTSGGDSNLPVLRAQDGSLWIRVDAGRHNVTLGGTIPEVDSLEIPFRTPPRFVTVNADGWLIDGIKDRRLLSGSLQLTRLQNNDRSDGAVRWESSRFPTFVRVERTVELDLDWRVRTTVTRLAPAQGALTVDVPLLDGETIVSGNFNVTDGRVLVSMGQRQNAVSWTSNLPRVSPLEIAAPEASNWQEVWHFVVGNIWNARFDGVPQSNTSNNATGVRVAMFHPRAGEKLQLTANRPEASAGSTLAFDAVDLDVTYGARSSDSTLTLNYRSTRGAQHVVQLPATAELTDVEIDGRRQTMAAENGQLTLPILPGEHVVRIAWRESGEVGFVETTPEIGIGAPASNIDLTVTRPQDRWLLATRGPKLGPAVLYWSELAALVIFALVLGRIGLTPLKTWHWLLLGLGFSTFSWPAFGIVVVWLHAAALREKKPVDKLAVRPFNLLQIVMAGLTVIALISIVSTLPQGLLGTPDMHVVGQNSYGTMLNWFADRSETVLPTASIVTAPMWLYKALILAWALWLSFSLLRWLPWVWQCFSKYGYWRKAAVIDKG